MTEFNLDIARISRQGFPEIVYAENKSADQLIKIADKFVSHEQNVLMTRVSGEKAERLSRMHCSGSYNGLGRTWSLYLNPPKPVSSCVGIVTAGTSDAFVAEEARETLRFLGVESKVFLDVGIAGLHRLVNVLPALSSCHIVIAIAGFEGALPSVIGGLIAQPVIAVPTSVGYGIAEGGRTALHAMLASCANGVTVVNIDGGFAAAMAAFRIFMGGGPKE